MSRDDFLKRQVKAFLDTRLESGELSQDPAVSQTDAAAEDARAFARVERRRRFGLALLFIAPVSMGCAMYLPAHTWFRWAFAVLAVFQAVGFVWFINRADLD